MEISIIIPTYNRAKLLVRNLKNIYAKKYPFSLETIVIDDGSAEDDLAEIRKSLGRRLSLDMVAAGTLGTSKIGDGLAAVRWWQQGEIEKIRTYCQEDVRLTKELYEYALAHQHLRYKIIQEVKQFPIDTSRWDEPASSTLNYTLPW